MKRIAALTLALVLILALAACGGGTGSSAAPEAPATETPASETAQADSGTPAAEGDTLTVWCWDPTFNIYAMQEAEKVYQQTNPDFKLEIVEVPWNDLQTKITTIMSSDTLDALPDILLCQDNAFQKNILNYPNLFMDISGYDIAFDEFAQAKLSYSIVDGKNYGVPFDSGAAIDVVRVDILEEAGYTVDDITDVTWDEYITVGKDVLAKTGVPLLSTITGLSDLIPTMLQSCGSSFFNEDGSPNIAGNEALHEVARVYRDLIQSGVCVELNGWDEYLASFTSGTVASTITGCWILGTVQAAEDQSGLWAVTNVPSLDVAGGTNYSNNGGSSWAITTNCRNPELATDFLAKTFGGSVEFYETILPSSGALSTWLPAGDSAVYEEPQVFFDGQAVYADIVEYSSHIPSTTPGMYYYEALDKVTGALSQIANGADLEATLQEADDAVKFQIGG